MTPATNTAETVKQIEKIEKSIKAVVIELMEATKINPENEKVYLDCLAKTGSLLEYLENIK